MEVFDRLGNSVVDKLKQYDVADDVEFYPIAVLYALDVMCGKYSNQKGKQPISFFICTTIYVSADDICFIKTSNFIIITFRFESTFFFGFAFNLF